MNLPDLTVPSPGSSTARNLLSRALGRLLIDLREVLRRPIADPRVATDLSALSVALASIPDRSGALSTVLRRTNVATLLRCARSSGDAYLVSELIATIAVELFMLGALTHPIRLTRPPKKIISLIGRVVIDVPPGELEVSSDLATTARRPFHVCASDIVLAVEDNNPLSMLEAHPCKSGNRIDLGGHRAEEWCASVTDTLERIQQYLPDIRREIDLYIQQVVPVGYDAESHLSASYREALGTIYLTLHPQPMTMTEAVIHEFSHNKINALFELDEVLHNAFSPLFKSPVRPDPRPLHGVLLAVHAFVPVARLYEKMLEASDPLAQHPSFLGRFRQIIDGNHEGIDVLRAHAEPTVMGREVLDELERWDQHFMRLRP